MHSKKVTILRAVALWVSLLCFAALQFQQGAPIPLVFLCTCLSFSLGILATLVLFFQAHESVRNLKEIRALCEGLYLSFFLMSIFTICLLSAQLRQAPWLITSLLILGMGALIIGSTVWVVILGMRALRAFEDKPEGE